MAIIASELGSFLDKVQNINSIEEAVKMVKQIDALKNALEAVDKFQEQSIKYAILQAEALLKVIELDGLTELKKANRDIAEWISEMDEETRINTINSCSDGVTLGYLYKMEMKQKAKDEEPIRITEMADYMEKSLKDALKNDGIVDASTPFSIIYDEAKSSEGKKIAADAVDGIRNRLRKCGALGVGNQHGLESSIYVMKDSGRTNEINRAIRTRIASIVKDYCHLVEIAKTCGISLSYQDLEPDFPRFVNGKQNDLYKFYGCVLDSLYEDGAITSFSKETSKTSAQFGDRTTGLNQRRRDETIFEAASEAIHRWNDSDRWGAAEILEYGIAPVSDAQKKEIKAVYESKRIADIKAVTVKFNNLYRNVN